MREDNGAISRTYRKIIVNRNGIIYNTLLSAVNQEIKKSRDIVLGR